MKSSRANVPGVSRGRQQDAESRPFVAWSCWSLVSLVSLVSLASLICASAAAAGLTEGPRKVDPPAVISRISGPASAEGSPRPAKGVPPISLTFADFFEPGAGLIPTSKILMASGQRVRMLGFMVRMEKPSERAFFLAPRPLICDEAGGGTADLTPDAVRVDVPWAQAPEIPFVPGPVEVVGTFAVGGHEEDDGRSSTFRITLDHPLPKSLTKASPSRATPAGDAESTDRPINSHDTRR